MSERTSSGTSVWEATPNVTAQPALFDDQKAAVCVVGAGIAGLTTAYLLAKAGRKVVVVDAGPGGGGETRYTTAHLASAIDDRYAEVERIRGTDVARRAAQSHSAAIDRIETIAEDEDIDCHFTRLDGFLFEPHGRGPTDLLKSELGAARRAGLTDVELLDRAPWPDFRTGACLRFPDQGQFHPLKYMAGLAAAFRARGGRLYHNTHVEEIRGGEPAQIRTREGPLVIADHVVVATNSPINDVVTIHTKQAPYTTYAVGLAVPRGYLPAALYWDTLDPYHYVRLEEGRSAGEALEDRAETHDVLIVGGEDHKTGQADDGADRHARLEAWARERFPAAEEVLFRWSGQVMETFDGLAFIGRNPGDEPNVYIATGDSGMGMTHGTIAGVLLSDLILGRRNRWADVYDPARAPLKTAGEYVKENLNVAGQYVKDWLGGGDVSSAEEIPAGQGAVLRRGLNKIACYRDESGALHEMSATCPHLGCVVHWNGLEKSWDCPCHGSRFGPEGEVVHGPAVTNLTPVTEAAAK